MASALPDFLVKCRIGLLKLNTCWQNQDPGQRQQHRRPERYRDQRQ
jgi:hypothetical protein